MPIEEDGPLAVLIPVYNDWECAALLIPRLDATLGECAPNSQVLLVDDASTIPPPENLVSAPLENIRGVSILHLSRNLGHQRAAAIGLYHIHQEMPCRAVVVMDGDGEDRPEDIAELMQALVQGQDRQIVFAARTRRMSTLLFRVCYHLYRLVHRVLTGVPVRVGNFSVVPHHALGRLMVVSDLWNHYAAAIFRSGLPYTMVPLARGRRLRGHSRMNFPALLVHGLSAIAVFSDVVSVRLLMAATGALLAAAGLTLSLAYVRFGAHLVVPGWAALATGLLLVICAQGIMLAVLLVFVIINARSGTSFIPLRDAHYFIFGKTRVYPQK